MKLTCAPINYSIGNLFGPLFFSLSLKRSPPRTLFRPLLPLTLLGLFFQPFLTRIPFPSHSFNLNSQFSISIVLLFCSCLLSLFLLLASSRQNVDSIRFDSFPVLASRLTPFSHPYPILRTRNALVLSHSVISVIRVYTSKFFTSRT